jgi:hypothetical protein
MLLCVVQLSAVRTTMLCYTKLTAHRTYILYYVCSDMRHGRGVLISGAKDLIYEGDWCEVTHFPQLEHENSQIDMLSTQVWWY